MYVNPIIVGIVFTILVEIGIALIYNFFKGDKK